MKAVLTSMLVLAATALSTPGHAQAQPDSSSSGAASDQPPPHRSGVLLGAKVGGVVPFGGLNPNARVGLEAGYVFPFAHGSFGAALDVDFAAPKTSGTKHDDPRVPNSTYYWHITEQELQIMPIFMYRLTSIKAVTPYAGIGPRIFLLRSTVRGDSGGATISETTEQSTKLGVGIPVGVELPLGPGGLIGELLFEYGSLDHRATGNSNTGGLNLLVGYRFLL